MTLYFVRLLHTDPGVRTDHLLSLSLSLPAVRYPHDDDQRHFYSALQQKLALLPAVESVGANTSAPFSGSNQSSDYIYQGGPARDTSHLIFADTFFITAGYFDTMQADLIRGRFFTEHDDSKSPKIAIINQSMAARLWPNQNAIGKHIQITGDDWQEIVGVIADVRNGGVALPAGMQVYLPAAQYPGMLGDLTVVVRTKFDPLELSDAVRQAVYSIDPALPVSNITPVQALAAQAVAGQSTATALIGSLGVLALLLASVGVYGIMSYSVSRRRREFGIRLALGAQRHEIFALLVGSTGRIAGFGISLGLLLTLPLNYWMRTLLGKTQELHPATLVWTALLLAAVAFFATIAPALRAAAVDPMQAIRTE
jgi:putative ABC transport system permease protein